MKISATNLPSLKNDPLRGNFQNSVPKEFTTSPIHVLCSNYVKFGRREVGEIARCLPEKKTKFLLALSLLRRSKPKTARASQRQTMYSECPKFHPNRFTSGRVIAERVNTVESRDKVFPMFGRSLASSRINIVHKYGVYFCKKILPNWKVYSVALPKLM